VSNGRCSTSQIIWAASKRANRKAPVRYAI